VVLHFDLRIKTIGPWRDQSSWHFGWRELTDELTVGRRRRAARPSGQGILALAERRPALILRACALGHELFSCAATATYERRSVRSIARTFCRYISTDESHETLVYDRAGVAA
jgi:hypothetical protein